MDNLLLFNSVVFPPRHASEFVRVVCWSSELQQQHWQ